MFGMDNKPETTAPNDTPDGPTVCHHRTVNPATVDGPATDTTTCGLPFSLDNVLVTSQSWTDVTCPDCNAIWAVETTPEEPVVPTVEQLKNGATSRLAIIKEHLAHVRGIRDAANKEIKKLLTEEADAQRLVTALNPRKRTPK